MRPLASTLLASSLLALGACATSAMDPTVDVDDDSSDEGSGSAEQPPQLTQCLVHITSSAGGTTDLEYDETSKLRRVSATYGNMIYSWSVVPVKTDTVTVDGDAVEFDTYFQHPIDPPAPVHVRITYHPGTSLPQLRVAQNAAGDVLQTIEYTYTGERLTSSEETDKNGDVLRRQRYYYDAGQHLTTMYEDLFVPGNTTPTFKYSRKYTRNGEGKLLKVEGFAGTTLRYTTTFVLDPQGLPTAMGTTGLDPDTKSFSYMGPSCEAAVERWRLGYFNADEP